MNQDHFYRFGGQLRAGKAPQRNPAPITVHRIERRRFARMAHATAQAARGCAEFVRVYSQYSRSHPRRYAARIAFDIAFRGIPF